VNAHFRLLFVAILGLWGLSGCGSSMTSYWKFDEGKGATAHDSIRSEDGQIYGAKWEAGVLGTSLRFDGSDDYVQTTRNIDQGGSTDITITAWVYPTRTGPGRHQIISTDDGGFDWSILRQGNQWCAFTGDASWGSGFNVDLNAWQHVAVVFKPDEDVVFYKNAVSRFRGSAPATDANDGNVAIGNNPGPWDEYFQGKIDEVAIYDRALSAKEIEKIYEKGAARCRDLRTADSQTNQRKRAEARKIRVETRKLRREAERVDLEIQKLREEIGLLRAETEKLQAEAENQRQQARKARAETEKLRAKSKAQRTPNNEQ